MKYSQILKNSILFLIAIVVGCSTDSTSNIALGTLERERILLTAVSGNIVTKIHVQVGDKVSEGDVLLQLDDSDEKIQLLVSEANLHAQQAILEKLQGGARAEDVAAARAKLNKANAELTYQNKRYKRIAELVKEKVQTTSDLDLAKQDLDSAIANSEEANENLRKLTNGSRPEDIAEASSRVDAAKANVELAKRKISDLKVTATKTGVIDALPWNEGERVSTGSPVVILLADGTSFARVYIPQPYRVGLKPGDEVKVFVDGMNKTFPGKIKTIASQPSFTPYYALNASERSRLVYLAEVTIVDTDINLPLGLPVEVKIL